MKDFIFPERPLPFIPELDYKILEKDDWIFEPKYDGWRIIVSSNGKIEFYTRKKRKLNLPFNNIKLPKGLMLDGELIAIDELRTNNYLVNKNLKNPKNLRIVLFDIMYSSYESIMDLPFIERRKVLEEIYKYLDNNIFYLSKQFIEKNRQFINEIISKGYEGVVFKNLNHPYEENGSHWIKLKHLI